MRSMFEEKVRALRKSPIHTLSFGSRDVFHTNFWTWLMEAEKEKGSSLLLEFLFPDGNFAQGKYAITREEQNRDITVWTNAEGKNKKAFVLENSMEIAIPKSELLSISEHLDEKNVFGSGVIAGIRKPPYDDELTGTGWHFISYREIGGKIREIASLSQSQNGKTILESYAKYIDTIYELLDAYLDLLDGGLPYYSRRITVPMKEMRLWDLAQQLAAERFLTRVESDEQFLAAKQYVESKGMRIATAAGFTRGIVQMDFRVIRGNGKEETALGVQLRKKQYRLIALRYGKQSKKETEDLYIQFLKQQWFLKVKDKKIKYHKRLKKTDMKKEFYTLDTRMEGKPLFCHFAYQYWIPDKEDRSFDTTRDNLITDLRKACDILSENI